MGLIKHPKVRDFVVSGDGLVFSVVSDAHPKDRVVAFLRFVPSREGLIKVGSTEESFRFLEKNYPEYVFYSLVHDAKLQAVPRERIREVIRPDVFLSKLSKNKLLDEHEEKTVQVANTLSERSRIPPQDFGVTGSVLVGAHSPTSDIDLVVYGRKNLEEVRKVISDCEPPLEELDERVLREMYGRRFPVSRELSFPEFCFHESRKYTSALFQGKRFHVLSARKRGEVSGVFGDVRYRRLGRVHVKAEVSDDSLAFDYPAVYGIHGACELDGKRYDITEFASYTHTYVGQVFKGEQAEARGVLEEVSGKKGRRCRLLVGSSREAAGEYIKLLRRESG
jgi:predicted nucleotidyltransferase